MVQMDLQRPQTGTEQPKEASPAAEVAGPQPAAKEGPAGLRPQAAEVAPLVAHWAEPGLGADKAEEGFKPATGTKKTDLKGTFGDFKVEHGLTKVPTKADYGEYALTIELTPNAKVGKSEVGFVQVSRQGKPDGGWATKKEDPYMTEDKAWRTEQKDGWRVDRANAKRDKTPFYGMHKDKGATKQYSTSRVGKLGGPTAMMKDVPGVAETDHMQFTATAMDMAAGTEFGALSWGYEYDAAKKVYKEETPALVDAKSDRMAGRDRAIDKWNKDVATVGSDIDKVPGK